MGDFLVFQPPLCAGREDSRRRPHSVVSTNGTDAASPSANGVTARAANRSSSFSRDGTFFGGMAFTPLAPAAMAHERTVLHVQSCTLLRKRVSQCVGLARIQHTRSQTRKK